MRAPGWPRDVVDREPALGRDGGGRYPREGLDVAVEVGLVGVAAFLPPRARRCDPREAVCRVVETDQLGGALEGEADLGPEPGPQPLMADCPLLPRIGSSACMHAFR
jgi:hypothetical protein